MTNFNVMFYFDDPQTSGVVEAKIPAASAAELVRKIQVELKETGFYTITHGYQGRLTTCVNAATLRYFTIEQSFGQ